jgi:CheY-like chemotaxis protein
MGSKLSLKSELNKGSDFYFDLEMRCEDGEIEEDADLPLSRVLIVDDNANNRTIIEHMLTYKGVESVHAENGLAALQLLMSGERFDVILMDYHMPILSGLETIEKIKELFYKHEESIPLIVLHTSSEEHEVISAFRQQERSFCLLKPIRSDELYLTLRKAIQQNKADGDRVRQEAESAKPSVYDQRAKVLIADDNSVNMALNLRMMASIMPNAELIAVVNGAEAIAACKQSQFDLILMDVQMPDVDGIEATKQIRLLTGYSDIPIIGITAGNVRGEKEKCLESGMSDFLPKPIRQHDLFTVLQKFVKIGISEQEDSVNLQEHLNLEALKDQIGDDASFKSFFLDLVVKEVEQAIVQLKNVQASADIDRMKIILHKLRGTAATAGLTKLAKLTTDLEKELTTSNPVFGLIDEIVSEAEIGLQLITKFLNEE